MNFYFRLASALVVVWVSLVVPVYAQSDLVITGVVDGPLTGGTPKAVELYVIDDVSDLSIYGIGSATNGGGSDGEELTLSGTATAGDYLYVASESTEFQNFLGFAPDFTGSAANINGDDAIELFQNGTVVDTFGDINTDGSGQPWEYTDGWAYRTDETGPDGSIFVIGNWSFSGVNALDGETTNASATTPFPIGTYQPPPTAPTVSFAAPNSQTVTEGTDTSFGIDVQITNAGNNAIDVDVVLTAGDAADFGGSSSMTVSFPASVPDGSTQTATFTLTDDMLDEGTETATFGLQNLSGDPTATIGSPDTYDLIIEDDDAAPVLLVINEINADPDTGSGDANNDGEISSDDDEFVEIVNTGSTDFDLSGYSVLDETTTRHTFPEGTILAPNQAILVFGGGDPQGNFGGALVQTTTSLGLNNSADTVTLQDATSTEVASVTYGSEGGNDQSITRDPDLTGAFVQHTSATGAGTAQYSPGTQVDGTPFGGGDADAIVTVIKDGGDAGWRMLSAPVGGVTVGDLAAQNLVQGLPDEYPDGDINLYSSYDGTAFIAPTAETDVLTSGEGLIWFLFDIAYDPADAGITNGDSESFPLPFTLQASGTEPGNVTVTLDNPPDPNNGNERWELLGNPFTEAIDVAQITVTGGSLVSIVGEVWDPAGAGSYVLTTDAAPTAASGNELAIWQGAFFQNNNATSVTIPTSAKLGVGSPFYGRQGANAERGRIGFELSSFDEEGEQASFDRAIVLYFSDDAADEWDLLDATKLTPIRSRYATLAFVGEREGNEVLKAQDSRPISGSSFEVPLAFEAAGVGGDFTLTWPRWVNVPEDWTITLTDVQAETTVDLRADTSYTFVAAAQREAMTEDGLVAPKPRSMQRSADAQFVLSVTRATTDAEDSGAAPRAFALGEVYPNPFATTATVPYSVGRATDVRLAVYDLLGREVAQLADGPHEAGPHTATLSGSTLASGVYFVRMTADGYAETIKVVILD